MVSQSLLNEKLMVLAKSSTIKLIDFCHIIFDYQNGNHSHLFKSLEHSRIFYVSNFPVDKTQVMVAVYFYVCCASTIVIQSIDFCI